MPSEKDVSRATSRHREGLLPVQTSRHCEEPKATWQSTAALTELVDYHSEKAPIIPLDSNPTLGNFVCAMGVFDGLHEGHRFLIAETIKQARQLGLPAIAITFDCDPDELFLEPAKQRKLLINEDRISLLAESGVDAVLVIPFERELSQRAPLDFLEVVIATHGNPKGIHVGSDFRFGYKAAGTVEDLQLWGESRGCEIFAHRLLSDEGSSVTATRIRNALQAGDLALANKLLTRPHYLWARVVKGRSAGKELGFPTANLELEERLVCPADGVYAGAVVVDGKLFRAAISVGVPSTFAGAPSTIEAHILDFDGDLYACKLQTFFFSYLRPMITFASVEELQQTVFENIAQARDYPLPENLPLQYR